MTKWRNPSRRCVRPPVSSVEQIISTTHNADVDAIDDPVHRCKQPELFCLMPPGKESVDFGYRTTYSGLSGGDTLTNLCYPSPVICKTQSEEPLLAPVWCPQKA
uniref:DUF4150 domain-containing protein n=1 Tax=Steinernema glaseri TaxID=37863 RepID=A0A1I8ATQ0_9BILA